MAIREVNSPLNSAKRPAPASNAALKIVNPPHAHPSAGTGPKAPVSSTAVTLPTTR
jgi:hypothetical protein